MHHDLVNSVRSKSKDGAVYFQTFLIDFKRMHNPFVKGTGMRSLRVEASKVG